MFVFVCAEIRVRACVGDEKAVQRNASDDRQATGTGTDHGRQFLHERQETVDGQMEGRRPESHGGVESPSGRHGGEHADGDAHG